MFYKQPNLRFFDRVPPITYLMLVKILLVMLSTSTHSSENPKVEIETNMGNIQVTLLPEHAPMTVANFLELVKEQHYDGLIFHRVIANFMIQAGGYTTKLEYRDSGKLVKNESSNRLPNTRGSIAMARTTDPDSASAEFYINVKDNKHLDFVEGRPGYTVFGFVTKGMDVVEKIELVDTQIQNKMPAVPEEPITMTSIRRL